MGDGVFFTGAALIAQQARQEALVNNIANSSTPGYKAAHVFADVLEEVTGSGTEALRSMERNKYQYIDFGQGVLSPTGRELDVALEGKGFFVILTPAGERYTRNGNFSLDGEGTLVNQDGHPVSSEGGPITLDSNEFRMNDAGEFLIAGEALGKLLVKDFSNPEGLQREGGGLFAARDGIRLSETDSTAKVSQGFLEDSNVSGSSEMMRMTGILKQFESASQAMNLQNATLRRVANELITG